LFGQLKKNRRVKPSLGVDLNNDGNITWYPLGVFYTTEWRAPTNDVYAELTARDRIETLKQRDFTTSTVYSNYTLYQLAEMLFLDYGFTNHDYSIDTALSSITVPYTWFDRVTYREALAQIAEAGLARLYCDRTGVIRLEVQRTTTPSLFAFADDETIYSSDYPLAVGQTYNYVETESKPRALKASEQIFSSSEIVSVPANGTLQQTYKFNFVPCMNVSAPLALADSGVTLISWTAYAWGMVATYTNSQSTPKNITSVTINGQKLDVSGGSVATAQDDQSIRDNGKLATTISNDFIQTSSRAAAISSSILAAYKDPRHDIQMDTRGHVTLQLGDRITAPGFDAGTTSDYYITRQETTWDGALESKIRGLKV
jgi:hypothetical protein